MSRIGWIYSLIFTTLIVSGGAFRAQATEPRDAWLMRNYHFTGPPPQGSVAPADPVVTELQQIQDMLLSIMRKADFAEDYEAALAAAAQAAENAQVIGAIRERLASAAAAKAIADEAKSKTSGPVYFIAFKDHTVETATRYWRDSLMLHYMTPEGAHVQVRPDLVDRDLSIRLNRAKNLEFTLPE